MGRKKGVREERTRVGGRKKRKGQKRCRLKERGWDGECTRYTMRAIKKQARERQGPRECHTHTHIGGERKEWGKRGIEWEGERWEYGDRDVERRWDGECTRYNARHRKASPRLWHTHTHIPTHNQETEIDTHMWLRRARERERERRGSPLPHIYEHRYTHGEWT